MIATAVIALMLAGPAAGLSDEEVRERVESYLGAIDRPIPSSSWRALGDRAVPHLEAVLRGDDLPTRRAAAASGLAAIGGDRARTSLIERAQADGERFVVRSAAMRGAARVVPPAELVQALSPVLSGARSPQVRAAAAEVLAVSGDAGGCGAVRAQARREGAAGRERYAKALSRCAR